MKAEENRRPSFDDASAMELIQLQEAAKIASIYHKGDAEFTKNTNITHVLHASLNLIQFVIAAINEIFHYTHHAIHHHRLEQDSTIEALPEERHPIFFIYPFCMVISSVFAILWIFTKLLTRYSIIAPAGCAIGGILMFLGSIYTMRHAEIHINLNQISDEELLKHPIFIHNFVLCIISIFGSILYCIQFWILYDYWRLLRKAEPKLQLMSGPNEIQESMCSSESNSAEFEISDSIKSKEEIDKEEVESVGNPYPIPAIEFLPSCSGTIKQNPNDEPVILYCCLVDCYKYIRMSSVAQKPTHEFQVIHVM